MREQRIAMEAVVDAYDSSERAMGWYYYLRDKMKVPFKAPCRFARRISVLKVKEKVEVLGMAPEEECNNEMIVWVRRAGKRMAVPLAQLQPLSKDQETQEGVGDWLYWVDRGYELRAVTDTGTIELIRSSARIQPDPMITSILKGRNIGSWSCALDSMAKIDQGRVGNSGE
jgi:hypothetical protein